jgi:hypothetical protein
MYCYLRGDTRVARRTFDRNVRIAQKRINQGVFSCTRADDEYLHPLILVQMWVRFGR